MQSKWRNISARFAQSGQPNPLVIPVPPAPVQSRQQQNTRPAQKPRRTENDRQQQAGEEEGLNEKQTAEREQNASKETINRLRSLMRERYRLDVWIWTHRHTPEANRFRIEEECDKSDYILRQIYGIVKGWQPVDFGGETTEDWGMALNIKETVLRPDQHVVWSKTPPWTYDDEESLWDSA